MNSAVNRLSLGCRGAILSAQRTERGRVHGNRRGVRSQDSSVAALLERVARGEEFMITKHGKPIARLVPALSVQPRRDAGQVVEELKAGRAAASQAAGVSLLSRAGFCPFRCKNATTRGRGCIATARRLGDGANFRHTLSQLTE